jgi:hypothetical protein
MRMWMVNPEVMCRQHLLGEHRELHAIVGLIRQGKSLRGYIARGLVEVEAIDWRHNELVQEMTKRGYHHRSILPTHDTTFLPREIQEARVDTEKSWNELMRRCERCRHR